MGKLKNTETKRRSRFVRILTIVLLISNFALAFVCLGLMGAGIYLVVDKVSYVTDIIDTPLIYTASVLVTIACGLTVIISMIGCVSLLPTTNKIVMFIFIGLLMAVMALYWTGASMAIVYRSWMSDQVRNHMRKTLQEVYGTNSSYGKRVTRNWDTAQQKWYCCGVEDNSWGLYRQSVWWSYQPGVPEGDKPLVPESCCVRDQYGQFIDLQKCQINLLGPPWIQSGPLNEAIFYDGCYPYAVSSLDTVAVSVIVTGIIMFCVLMAFVVVSSILQRRKSR